MKKLFTFAVLVAAVLTSCVNSVEVPDSIDEIAFQAVTYKSQAGRAPQYGPMTGATYNTAEHFGAYAFHSTAAWSESYTPATYMEKVDISLVGSDWKNKDRSYHWPKTGQLSFVCYSPYEFGTGTLSATATKGIKIDGFTATNTLAEQVDLMTMDVLKDQTSKGGKVEAAFKHILSQIVFTVAPKEDLSESVKSITLDGLVLKAVDTKANYAQTDWTVASGAWSNHSTEKDYTFLTAPQGVSVSNTTAVNVGNAAIVIPQACLNYEVLVSYTITYHGDAQDVVKNASVKIATPSWDKGLKYVYNLQIGLGSEIIFTPSIPTDWTPGTGADISIG
jgi:hypothetical protein